MASKRRRSYRGTPEYHLKKALESVRSVRTDLTHARRQIASGSCTSALNSLRLAEWELAKYDVHRLNAPRRYTLTNAADAAVRSSWAKFAKKCLR